MSDAHKDIFISSKGYEDRQRCGGVAPPQRSAASSNRLIMQGKKQYRQGIECSWSSMLGDAAATMRIMARRCPLSFIRSFLTTHNFAKVAAIMRQKFEGTELTGAGAAMANCDRFVNSNIKIRTVIKHLHQYNNSVAESPRPRCLFRREKRQGGQKRQISIQTGAVPLSTKSASHFPPEAPRTGGGLRE